MSSGDGVEVVQPVQKRAKTEEGAQKPAATSLTPLTPQALNFSGVFVRKHVYSTPWEAQLPPIQHPPTAQDRTNFTKGCKFAPDGSAILVASEDAHLRVISYDDAKPEAALASTLDVKEGETVYDYAWYPFMNRNDVASCCFVATTRGTPIHLWDSVTGKLRASYVAYDHLDEPTAANSVAFNLHGSKIFAGYNRMVRVFDVGEPGHSCESHATSKTRKSRDGQRGILSCISFNPDYSGVYAMGSYNGTAVIYDESTHESLLELPCQSNGVTQVKFSANGAYLFVAGRQSNDILCWDVRMTRSVVSTLKRRGNTNQRIEFDVEPLGRHLITGSVDSAAIVYDLNTASEVTSVEGFSDAVNGVSVHPLGTCVAFTTGQRHFPLPRVCDDSDDDSPSGVEPTPRPFPELSIWKCEMG